MGFSAQDEYVEGSFTISPDSPLLSQRSLMERFQEEFARAVSQVVERSLAPRLLVPDAPGVREALRRAGVAVPQPSASAVDDRLGDPATRLIRE